MVRITVLCFSLIIMVISFGALADTHTAASVSYSDVNAAVSAASSGDTVFVPAGTATWSSTLTITKGITFQGAGIDSTIIRSNINNNNAAFVNYVPSNPALNEPFNLTGFTIDGMMKSQNVVINNTSNTPITKVRIYLNKFTHGKLYGLTVIGPVYGVAFSNQFVSNSDTYAVIGHNQDSYDHQTASFGTADAFFLEDNTIEAPTSTLFQNANGGQFVFRYNTINNYSNSGIMDIHGNNHNPVAPGYAGARACLNVEVYGNTFNSTRGSPHRWFYVRGGALLMYDNELVGSSANSFISLMDYDCSGDNLIPALVEHGGIHYICKQDHTSTAGNEPGTGGGAAYWDVTALVPIKNRYITWATGIDFLFSKVYDPIIDTYLYNNKENGSDVPITLAGNTSLYIFENINYWLLNPRGRTIKGRSYQPYTYPHPLQEGAGVILPLAPTGLKLK